MVEESDAALSFGADVGAYDRGRPEYLPAAVEWLLAPVAGSGTRVLDVGAGTGKLTRAIAAVTANIVAVEPDPAMLEQLRGSVPGVETFVGTAESLPFGDGVFDAVVVGQAWHWVEPVGGSREIGRVLRPGGVLGLVWNLRDDSQPLIRRLHSLTPQGGALDMLGGGGLPPVAEPFGEVEAAEWQWTRPVTRAEFTDMVRSRSFFLTASAEDQAATDRALAVFCDDIGLVGESTVDLPYVTRAFRAVRC